MMSFFKSFSVAIFGLASVVVLYLFFVNYYTIADLVRLNGYKPNSLITDYVNASGMSDKGRDLFYVSYPEVLLETEFDEVCKFEELGLVLGCFDGRKIYVLDVQEARLEPVETVTAAHEMLHVAYSRLDETERERINNLLDEQFEKVNNKRIQDEIDGYKKDPNADIHNEMHSILGTEYKDLGKELEEYYSKFFDDRSKVLQKSAQYEDVFNEINAKIDSYDRQLAALKSEIDVQEGEIGLLQNEVRAERVGLEMLEREGRYEEYNAKVPGFNAMVNQYNSLIVQVEAKIKQYNDIVKLRNENVFEQNDLIKSLDSDFETL